VQIRQRQEEANMQIKYLIVGGGLTGDAACKGIRGVDTEGTIVMVGDERHPPYSRPPLSKALWKGTEENTIWRGTAALGVDLRLGHRIVALDLDRHEARSDAGKTYTYEKLLLATGCRPRQLPFGGEDVIYFRTLDDYRKVRAFTDIGVRFGVIGGGFIGSEIAAALALNGARVTMVFPDRGIGTRIFPRALSTALVEYYRDHGVEVLPAASVTAIERHDRGIRIMLGGGRPLDVDMIVAGIGVEPNAELAVEAGLPVANGIVVDRFGRVGGREDVFAAGDVARFPVEALASELRVEHEDHALSHGRCVGANMAGAGTPYDHLPFFYSDLFDVGYEAVGALDSRLEMRDELGAVTDQGVVYYLDSDRKPRGVLLWNRFGGIDDARELIRTGTPFAADARPPAAASRRG
jgi:3-phenylpropionate/trans-cinnamate dioxygenase ferredoxin reductase subunit